MPRRIGILLITIFCTVTVQPAFAQESAVCLLAYEDTNQNGVHDPQELPFAGIGVNLVGQEDLIIGTHVTTESMDFFCFEGLSAGTYTVRFEESPNHTPTTENIASLTLAAGQRLRLEYGAVPQSPFLEADEAPTSTGDKVDTVTRLLISLMAAVLAMILMLGIGAVAVSRFY